MTGNFYKNNSDNKVLNKDLNRIINDIPIILKDDTDLLNPTFILDYSQFIYSCNYVYIPELYRYYYIDNIIYSQQRVYIECHTDVLMTYRTEILNLQCIIKRQQYKYNLYLNDEKYKAYEYSRVQTKEFPNGFTTNAFILAIAGG